MGLFNDILDEIMDAVQGDLRERAKQIIEQKQLKNKLNNMEEQLDKFLLKNYENEIYFDSLYRYIHNGKVSQDTDSNDTTSAFYYTLFCAFLNSDDRFLGEIRFSDYHWDHIQKNYPNGQYDEYSIKKCFLHYYNVFEAEFCNPSDTDRALVNALKETVNENSDNLIKTISDGNDLIRGAINEGIEKILKHGNLKGNVQTPKKDKIYDDNKEYQERLQDSLFLETDIDDGQKASLADVYIKPHIEFDFCDLKQWAEDRDSRILLLYGKAGIGKTSYTSWLSLNNDFTRGCHILELRKCIQILDSKDPWKSIKNSYKCMNDDEYQNKVLILDGLDEVCVLKSDFDGQEFIFNLNNTLKTGIGRSIRIIISSRMGYFNDIKRKNHIDVATIFWEEDSVVNWCNAYCKIHNNRVDWCESFKRTYAGLETKDKRKEVFCTPLILYICCVSQVDVSKHNSVASIYDEAFNVIGTRRYNEWTEASREEFEINRQFTKELALQMFLNDKLEDVLSSNFVQIAKEKVVCLVLEKRSYQVKELEFEKLFAINHFACGKNNAIEFAHKTIGEYFTAVKLYEDYFEQIDGTAENIWCNIFNAFRYKTIPSDIMKYLVDLILNRQDESWKERFFKAYYTGIENQSLSAVACFKSEYSTSSVALMNQMQIAFRNLTWLLTGLGFDNGQFINSSENLQILASYFYGDVNISGWKNLENINLSYSYLENAKFKRACLKNVNFASAFLNMANFHNAILESANFLNANLKRADLTEACLIESDLTKVNLQDANLAKTTIKKANLTGADLTRANLTGANLKRADITNADLTSATLTDANLTKAVLNGTNLRGAKIISTILTGADLRQANIKMADLSGADFTEADLTVANLIKSNLFAACFIKTKLIGANLEGADLTETNLTQARLIDADLTEATLIEATLIEANLKETNLTGAYLTKANFAEATLIGVNLEGSDLTRANLTRANLTGADLTRANLTKTNFTGADLAGASLTRADLTEAKFIDANLKGADLTRANLTRAYLIRADFTGANLTKANLTRANLTRANLTNTKLKGADLTETDYDDGASFVLPSPT